MVFFFFFVGKIAVGLFGSSCKLWFALRRLFFICFYDPAV